MPALRACWAVLPVRGLWSAGGYPASLSTRATHPSRRWIDVEQSVCRSISGVRSTESRALFVSPHPSRKGFALWPPSLRPGGRVLGEVAHELVDSDPVVGRIIPRRGRVGSHGRASASAGSGRFPHRPDARGDPHERQQEQPCQAAESDDRVDEPTRAADLFDRAASEDRVHQFQLKMPMSPQFRAPTAAMIHTTIRQHRRAFRVPAGGHVSCLLTQRC